MPVLLLLPLAALRREHACSGCSCSLVIIIAWGVGRCGGTRASSCRHDGLQLLLGQLFQLSSVSQAVLRQGELPTVRLAD